MTVDTAARHSLANVRAFQTREIFEKAIALADQFPSVRLNGEVAAALPGYRAKRDAARAWIAANGPDAPVPAEASRDGYSTPGLPTRVNVPPTEAETLALSKRIAGSVKRLSELRPLNVDNAALRRSFQEAIRNGGSGTAEFREWIAQRTAQINRGIEVQRLERWLGIDTSEGSLPLLQDGQPYSPADGMPDIAQETAWAMSVYVVRP